MRAAAGGLGRKILEVAGRNEKRLALSAANENLTYGELIERATALAGALVDLGAGERGARVAVLADRTCDAYVGIVATLLAGAAYVPLNPHFPVQRNHRILENSGAMALVVDPANVGRLADLLAGREQALPVVLTRGESPGDGPGWRVATRPGRGKGRGAVGPVRDDDDIAYLLFTSGSTGAPKGVPISHGNVAAYLATAERLSGVASEDRLIQVVDLTFDLSVHDMFLAWTNGASLFSVPERAAILATRLVEEYELTGWMSVPSTASLALQSGQLRSRTLPSLRFTFFCGEALPAAVARAWAAAAPASTIYNLYGPTEATVAFSAYKYTPGGDPGFGVVPIGEPFPGQSMGLYGDNGQPVAPGAPGEICLSGSQLTPGYWNAPDLNRTRFFESAGRRWYRTGDVGRYDPSVGFVYGGRLDDQVKIRGFRVELQEIENVIRAASGSTLVAVVPLVPHGEPIATGCAAFVVGDPLRKAAIVEACRAALPDYMVPAEVFFVAELPLNANGKIDRTQLSSHTVLEGFRR